MHARLKGAFYGTLTFGFLALAYIMGKMLSLSAGTHGGEVGWDVGGLAVWTVGNRVFWLLFALALVVGSEVVHYWEGAASRPGKPKLPWWIRGTLVGVTTFLLGSLVYLVVNRYLGGPAVWAGLVASMAFGYYLAKSSSRFIWILKGAFIGSVALVPILAFYFLIRARAAERARANIASLKQLTVHSPSFWIILVLTLAWACYVNKPSRQTLRPPSPDPVPRPD